MSEKYLKEYEAGYNPKLVMEEASRCLLCHDAPCSKACPAGTDPAKFIRSVRFKNVKGAAETVRVNNILGAICARVCPTERYCQQGCSRSGIDKPIDIGGIQRYVTDFEDACKMDILEKTIKELKKNGYSIRESSHNHPDGCPIPSMFALDSRAHGDIRVSERNPHTTFYTYTTRNGYSKYKDGQFLDIQLLELMFGGGGQMDCNKPMNNLPWRSK